jgi:hypothetical protein
LNTATNLNDPNFGLSIGFAIHYSILEWWKFGKNNIFAYLCTL